MVAEVVKVPKPEKLPYETVRETSAENNKTNHLTKT